MRFDNGVSKKHCENGYQVTRGSQANPVLKIAFIAKTAGHLLARPAVFIVGGTT